MSVTTSELLDIAEDGVRRARAAGADEVEVFVSRGRETRIDLKNDDVLGGSSTEETMIGVRVFRAKAQGFATVNRPEDLALACDEAAALAGIAPADPRNGLLETPLPITTTVEGLFDTGIENLEADALVDRAAGLLARIRERDARVRLDSGEVWSTVGEKAIATSTGIRSHERQTSAGGGFFGMAVEGEDIGSFDYDGHVVRAADRLLPELEAAADRFVTKALASLGAHKGESFKGACVFTPEVVSSFILNDLLGALDARAVRTGRSPLGDDLGKAIASPLLDVYEDPHLPGGTASTAFDREGTPTLPRALVRDGVLEAFLHDVYEARAAGRTPTGHARGGASAGPRIGPSNLVVRPGEHGFAHLASQPGRQVVVSRFSGSSSPITGEFSGVVKGGFLVRDGERTPIKETLVAGNLFDLLRSITHVSSDRRDLNGLRSVPGLRADGLSITAG